MLYPRAGPRAGLQLELLQRLLNLIFLLLSMADVFMMCRTTTSASSMRFYTRSERKYIILKLKHMTHFRCDKPSCTCLLMEICKSGHGYVTLIKTQCQ